MRTLRETTQKEMAAALETVRAARDAALVTIAAHVEAHQVKDKVGMKSSFSHMLEYHKFPESSQTPVLTSSKRKRNDEQDEDDSGGDESQSDPTNNPRVKSHRRVHDVGVGVSDDRLSADPAITPTATLVTSQSGIDVPSPKRARRVAAVVVQTATAVTVGAVATWSALAFS
jgi:hypothetical protein